MMKKAVFLDRDGTINVEKNYLYRPEEFEFIAGVPEAIALLNRRSYLVIVVSNQAGVARGYYSEKDVYNLHTYVNRQLENYSAHIDKFYFCPHHPDAGIGKYKVKCHCRKPETGMFEQACQDYSIDKASSWMIGDNRGDILAGKRFGLKTVLVKTGYGQALTVEGFADSNFVADDLPHAVRLILNLENKKIQSIITGE